MVCVSRAASEELKHMLNDFENQITFINNPISFLNDQSNTSEHKNNTLIYVGRLSPEKNPLEMLKIWQSIAPKHPDWNFQLLGDGVCYPEMKSYIEEHKLQNIELLGSVFNVELKKK